MFCKLCENVDSYVTIAVSMLKTSKVSHVKHHALYVKLQLDCIMCIYVILKIAVSSCVCSYSMFVLF